jgi:class 3 adenylate cyclase/tetratricopeptide (TPR) repeat protein
MAVVCPSCGTENPDSAKFCSECAAPIARIARPRESRRTVTILFADVAGSTALGEQLDPESLRALMGRYFAAIKGIVERHGGTVEKFIGDAVMAVFGIPTIHEDDALRAVRAATEIRDTLAALNDELYQSRGFAIAFRTGVNTGEVVAGDPSAGNTFVTGDTVNTAARLEQAAQPGEILLGQSTYRLVRDAVVADPTEPINAKGKAEPLPAYRLDTVTAGAPGHARGLGAQMFGRDADIRMLGDAFDRAVADQAGQLITVLGEAGVGKSRLIHEFRQRVEGKATFLMGHCLSYGEGITYWPLADALRAPVGVSDDNSVESWRSGLMALTVGLSQAEAIVEQVMSLIGVAEAAGGSDASWAVRRLLEGMARRRPLIFAVDDLHWATPTFLDLVEHVVDWTRDVPILLVCLSRPELLDQRPGWAGGKANATTLLLEPLDADSIDELVAHLVTGVDVATERRRRIAAAAEGNPLFVEELVAMLAERDQLMDHDDGNRGARSSAELEVPPTIEALMAARLDQLPAAEREVLERASVIGTQFGAGEVAQLSDEPGPASVRPVLMAMVRRDLVRPNPEAMLPIGVDDEAFRFRHQLIRDAAYAGMSKAERARLHHRYAGLLEELPAEQLAQLDEVVGYHLEQASVLWASLGGEPRTKDTASRAAAHLAGAGLRAYDRIDWAATANLLTRAATLLPRGDPQRVAVLPRLGRTLLRLGRLDDAQAALNEAIEGTADGSNPAARVFALWVRATLAWVKGADEAKPKRDIQEALAIAEATGDPAQLAYAHGGLAGLAMGTGQLREARRELEFVLDAATRSGDPNLEAEARFSLAEAQTEGPDPAAEIDRILAENLAWARDHGRRRMEAHMLRAQASEAANRGRMDEAQRLMADCTGIFEEVGSVLVLATNSWERGNLEFLAGDHAARERVLREGYEQLSAMGERGALPTIAADLADALIDLGRIDEADTMRAVAEEASAEHDMTTQVGLRLVRGRLAAARGKMEEALASVADALSLADQGEMYDRRIGSRLVLAQLLLDSGRTADARARAQEILDLARPGRDIVLEARAMDLIERMAAAESPSHRFKVRRAARPPNDERRPAVNRPARR